MPRRSGLGKTGSGLLVAELRKEHLSYQEPALSAGVSLEEGLDQGIPVPASASRSFVSRL
ncbi:hypothetical protein Pph01_02070 [Planotetraspora phitsanulokensis]|uniref:Uncharacterized protein n=1 Tax=Planotetraspora phitsanulokensis TaxID=575192 RepID=A0A8J3U334_9ACTN|nr:hypothetical protein Pph01_02070 [Planotetraspora phitsanulokensis]